MKTTVSLFAFVLLLTLTIAHPSSPGTLPASNPTARESRVGADESAANDFALTDENGRPFHLARLRGKIVLLFFGYTHCPDACPTTMSKLTRVYKLLGTDAKRLVTLFVSVDPGRDTPEVLKSYLAYFRVNSIGLTGTKAEIDSVVKQYGARYEIEQSDSAAGYHINHSTDLYLIDPGGKTAGHFDYGDGTQIIVAGVKHLL